MTKSTYTVGSIFVLYITTSVVTYATQCCMHGPIEDSVKGRSVMRCTTVSSQSECDGQPAAVLRGAKLPNYLKPGIDMGTGKCLDDGLTCCSVSVSKSFSSIDINSVETCSRELLVKLSNFTATPTDEGISLNWNTETELDSQGFRIWRAIPDLSRYCGCSGNIEDYTQIQVLDKEGKPVLIPAKGSKTSGFDYSYLDEKAKPGIAYCYALEDVDSKGESKFYFEYVAFTQDNLE